MTICTYFTWGQAFLLGLGFFFGLMAGNFICFLLKEFWNWVRNDG